MAKKVVIWDNHGTITSFDDQTTIMPNVEKLMHQKDTINIICSGTKTVQTESRDIDPHMAIDELKRLMNLFPITYATFSPKRGGV